MSRRAACLVALPLFLIAACSQDTPSDVRPPVPVVAQRVALLPEEVRVEAVGSARAATSAQIFPEAAGMVERVFFTAGDYVRRGAPLIEIDARRERLAVELARVQVREADQLLGRYRRIEGTGAISESQIEAGETALASARIELQQAETALADRTIRAPFSGHIGLTEIDRGDRVEPTTMIAQLDNRATLYVDFPAPEAIFARLKTGSNVSLTPFANPGEPIAARVVAVDSTISEDQRAFTVRAAIDNRNDRLRPGMSFRVIFTGSGERRAAAPEQAVVWGGEGAYLWIVRDGKARRVPVNITSRREGLVFVDAALRSGDMVVVEGVQKLREGQAVRLVRTEPPAAQKVAVQRSKPGGDAE